jgi:hypothetical protein
MVKPKDIVNGKPYLWVHRTRHYRAPTAKLITMMGIVKVNKILRRKSDLYWLGKVVAPIVYGKYLSNYGKFSELYELNKITKHKVKGFMMDPRLLPNVIISGIFEPKE